MRSHRPAADAKNIRVTSRGTEIYQGGWTKPKDCCKTPEVGKPEATVVSDCDGLTFTVKNPKNGAVITATLTPNKGEAKTLTAQPGETKSVTFAGTEGLKVAVVGNIDAATLAPLLDKLLGSLPAKSDVSPMPEPMQATVGCALTPMNVPQAVVQFGSLAPKLTFRQQIAWTLLNTIMAEGISDGRLNRELREKRGLIYGISLYHSDFSKFAVFTGALSVHRVEAAAIASDAGCEVDEGVTKRTTILVVGDQDLRQLAGYTKSAKHRKAEQLAAKGQHIRILFERDFYSTVAPQSARFGVRRQ